MSHGEEPPVGASGRQERLAWLRRPAPAAGALVLGVLAVLSALIAALGPAHEQRSHYEWPPDRLPTASPTVAWVSPLMLMRKEAETLRVRLSCSLPPPLPATGRQPSTTVVSTARDPIAARGLAVVQTSRGLVVRVGSSLVTAIPWPPRQATSPACERILTVAANAWSLSSEDGSQLAEGVVPEPPLVTGLFSNLDLRQGGLSVRVTTEVHGTSPSTRQRAAAALAIVLAVAALALALGLRATSPRRGRRIFPHGKRSLQALRPVDGIVVGVLFLWWVVGPAFYDDGWVRARQLNYAVSGSFSNYYDTWGVGLPLSYWLEWLQHWLFLASGGAAVPRLLPLGCGLVMWTACRWCVSRATGPLARFSAPIWTLAAVFLVGFVAWGMTLRPEPVVALLAVGVLAAMLRFVREPSLGPLAVTAFLGVLAVTAHPSGIVALAPFLASVPEIAGWVRRAGTVLVAKLATVVLSAGSSFILLFFLDSDVAHRRSDYGLFRAVPAHQSGWRDELSRYTSLSDEGWGTPARRASVALLLLAVLAYAARGERSRRPQLDIPAASLAISLLLLVLTPSKWPWHFGTLVALGAVALAAEVSRLSLESANRPRWSLRPFVIILAVLGANGWAWDVRTNWVIFDLTALSWRPDAGEVLSAARGFYLGSFSQWVAVVCAVLLVVGAWELRRRGRARLPAVPWIVAIWTVTIVSFPLLFATVGTFVRDAMASDWTLGTQNVESLQGKQTCGLGDQIVIPVPGSLVSLPPVPDASAPTPPTPTSREDGVPDLAFSRLGVFPSGSAPPLQNLSIWGSRLPDDSARGRFVSPWFSLPEGGTSRVGLFVAGSLGEGNVLALEWGRRTGAGIRSVQLLEIAGSNAAGEIGPHASGWSFLAAGSLPPRPEEADALRVAAVDGSSKPGGWIGFSAPVRYVVHSLTSAIQVPEAKALISPTLALYFPCWTPPRLQSGVAEMPTLIILPESSGLWPLNDPTSPFSSVLDLRQLYALPVTDSSPPPRGITLYRVSSALPGEVVLPPMRYLGD